MNLWWRNHACIEGMPGSFTWLTFLCLLCLKGRMLFLMPEASWWMLMRQYFILSLPRHLFCMQFFKFVNSHWLAHTSVFGVWVQVNKWAGFCFQITEISLRKMHIPFHQFRRSMKLQVISVNTVIHNWYESCILSMATDGLDRYKFRIIM